MSLRPELPPLPSRMERLPVDHRGYPVPWFVTWLDEDDNPVPRGQGRPEFRVIEPETVVEALTRSKCWICGQKLGRFKAYVAGPMCAINRISSEPPSHRECAEFAARACPFLVRPHSRRRDNALPSQIDPDEPSKHTPGTMLQRNPGVAMVWVTAGKVRNFPAGQGLLFDLGEPEEVLFFAEGREATRGEVADSIRSGYGALWEAADAQNGVDELETLRDAAFTLLPPLSAGERACAKCGTGVTLKSAIAEFRKPICAECFDNPPEKQAEFLATHPRPE